MAGMTFKYLGKKENTMSKMHTLEERTIVTTDGKLAGPKHKGAGRLLGNKGDQITLAHAIELGLAQGEKKEEKKA